MGQIDGAAVIDPNKASSAVLGRHKLPKGLPPQFTCCNAVPELDGLKKQVE